MTYNVVACSGGKGIGHTTALTGSIVEARQQFTDALARYRGNADIQHITLCRYKVGVTEVVAESRVDDGCRYHPFTYTKESRVEYAELEAVA